MSKHDLTPPPSTPAMIRNTAFAAALGLATLGCGEATTPPTDGGTSSTDAGFDADIIAPMPPPGDAGTDAGPDGTDAGPDGTDAGEAGDAGPGETDAGSDSGVIAPMPPPRDAGSDSGVIAPMPPPMPPPPMPAP